MFKVNNKVTRTIFHTRTYFTPSSSVSLVKFEHVNAGWDQVLPLTWWIQVRRFPPP